MARLLTGMSRLFWKLLDDYEQTSVPKAAYQNPRYNGTLPEVEIKDPLEVSGRNKQRHGGKKYLFPLATA